MRLKTNASNTPENVFVDGEWIVYLLALSDDLDPWGLSLRLKLGESRVFGLFLRLMWWRRPIIPFEMWVFSLLRALVVTPL